MQPLDAVYLSRVTISAGWTTEADVAILTPRWRVPGGGVNVYRYAGLLRTPNPARAQCYGGGSVVGRVKIARSSVPPSLVTQKVTSFFGETSLVNSIITVHVVPLSSGQIS